jgi:hypothetical protein
VRFAERSMIENLAAFRVDRFIAAQVDVVLVDLDIVIERMFIGFADAKITLLPGVRIAGQA